MLSTFTRADDLPAILNHRLSTATRRIPAGASYSNSARLFIGPRTSAGAVGVLPPSVPVLHIKRAA